MIALLIVLAGYVAVSNLGHDAQVVAGAQVTSIGTVPSEAYDYESITVSSAAVGLTASKINPTNQMSAKLVILTVETATLRYRYDGNANPTTAEGHLSAIGDSLLVAGINNISRLRLIRATGSDSTVKVTYLR